MRGLLDPVVAYQDDDGNTRHTDARLAAMTINGTPTRGIPGPVCGHYRCVLPGHLKAS